MQDEAVGDIMIATWTQLEPEPSPFQSTHAPSNRTVSCSAALFSAGRLRNRS